MNEEELSALKYRQLQKIAKVKGLKANLPKDALIKGILKCQEISEESTETTKDGQNILNTSFTAKLESTISSTVSSLSENETGTDSEGLITDDDDAAEPKKLNETFEVKESSILTNDEEEMPSNSMEKKTISAFNTPTLMNASDRFEQFFGIDDEHIPVMTSPSPKKYSPKHASVSKASKSSSIKPSNSISNTPTEKLQNRNTSQMDVFTRLSLVPSRRSSVACTPKGISNEKPKPYSALKGYDFKTKKILHFNYRAIKITYQFINSDSSLLFSF